MTRYLLLFALAGSLSAQPAPPGKLVDLGGHNLHVNCTGKGSPTVVVENGFDEFSSDWILVQTEVEKFTHICTYDRAGYSWSDPGPKPRTFAQINLELHDALKHLDERGPFVLVGHSYGGGPVRTYAVTYPKEVAGIVLVEAVGDTQRIQMGPKNTGVIADSAQGKAIPAPHEKMTESDRQMPGESQNFQGLKIKPPYDRLPETQQKMWLWAIVQPQREDAANGEREWSPEYISRWVKDPKSASLGSLPLIVLTRAKGGFGDGLDVPDAQLEKIRLESQANLAKLSTQGTQRIIVAGHDMHLEAPDQVTNAIRELVDRLRKERHQKPKAGALAPTFFGITGFN